MSDPRHPIPEPHEAEELRRVIMLLRELPDPEPPADLSARVMEAVARGRRGGVVRGAFRRAGEPRFAAALAAGVAGLLLYGAIQPDGLPLPFAGLGPDAPLEATRLVPTQTPAAGAPGFAAPVARIASTGAVRRAPTVVYFGGPEPSGLELALEPHHADSPDHNLDRQLNRLLLDPPAFFSRLENVAARERFVARLAERSAQRGDAAEVALHLRRSGHPEATQVSDRFLRAALVQTVGTR